MSISEMTDGNEGRRGPETREEQWLVLHMLYAIYSVDKICGYRQRESLRVGRCLRNGRALAAGLPRMDPFGAEDSKGQNRIRGIYSLHQ